MGRLFHVAPQPPDLRPTLFSVAGLMLLLLPLTLMTSSAQKLTGLSLGVPGPSEQLPPEQPGPVEGLEVIRVSQGYQVSATVRSTDVLAGAGDTEQKTLHAPRLDSLQEVLRRFKGLDPARERITLRPMRDTPTEEVVRWMDAVRADPQGELFPRVILATGAP